MVPFATRALLNDKVKLIIAVGGISFAVLLILILRAILNGTVAKATTYIDHVGADYFIAQKGVDHFALSTSAMPAASEVTASAVPGVEIARGIITTPLVLNLGGADVAVRLVAYDVDSGFGGPWRLSAGSDDLVSNGVIIDDSLARRAGLHIGQTITIGNTTLLIQGFSAQTNNLGGKLVFMRRETAAQILSQQGVFSYLLVRAEGDTAGMGAALKEAFPDASVLSRAELSRNDQDLLSNLFITPVNVMATIGLIVGAMVLGLTVYTSTADRLRDFGVLKAIGAPDRFLYGVVLRLAMVLGLGRFGLGTIAGLLLKPLIEFLVPDLGVEYHLLFVLEVMGLTLLVSLVASCVPVFRIAGVDPKQVFKA